MFVGFFIRYIGLPNCITVFRSITVFCGTDIIMWNVKIPSVPHHIVMDLNNVMCVHY